MLSDTIRNIHQPYPATLAASDLLATSLSGRRSVESALPGPIRRRSSPAHDRIHRTRVRMPGDPKGDQCRAVPYSGRVKCRPRRRYCNAEEPTRLHVRAPVAPSPVSVRLALAWMSPRTVAIHWAPDPTGRRVRWAPFTRPRSTCAIGCVADSNHCHWVVKPSAVIVRS